MGVTMLGRDYTHVEERMAMSNDRRSVDLVGYQIRFRPLVPFSLARAPRGPGALPDISMVAHMVGGGVRNVMICPGKRVSSTEFQRVRLGDDKNGIWSLRLGDDGTSVILGARMKDVADVGMLAAYPSADSNWQIETKFYKVAWPDDYVVHSSVPDTRWPFELHGTRDRAGNLIILRGPLYWAGEVPRPPQLVAPGQEVVEWDVDGPTPWIEVRYTVGGQVWRQRHFYAALAPETIVIVTVQGPERRAGTLAADGKRVASSIRPARAGASQQMSTTLS
jgi:hypothetical protein